MLSAGLLIGSAGGGIAAADTDTSGSAPSSNVDVSAAASTTNEPAASPAAPVPGSTLQKSIKNTLAFINKLGQQQAEATKRLLTTVQATPTVTDTKGSDVSEEIVAPLATDTTEVAPETTYVAPVTELAAGSSTTPPTPLSTVVKPMSKAAATVLGAMASVPGVVAALPASETPVTDVITTMETMLTTVMTDAVLPLVSVPSDLYTLLAATQAETPTTIIGDGASFVVAPVAAVDAPLLPPVMQAWPQVVLNPDVSAAHSDVLTLAAGEIALAGFSEGLSISGTAPLATQSTTTGVLPVLEHAVAALLVPVSLSTLAALAIPGVAGLLIVCAAGIRIGYRQAKAGLMLRASGIARFAGSGPLGVVRSGSMVALRFARPTPSRPSGFMDQVA